MDKSNQAFHEVAMKSSSSTLSPLLLRLDADKVLSAFGKYGRYQMQAYFLTNFVMFFFATEMLVMAYITMSPAFQCQFINNANSSISTAFVSNDTNDFYEIIDKCTIINRQTNDSMECGSSFSSTHSIRSRFIFNETSSGSRLPSEFNLVCSREHWSQLGTSMFVAGGMIVTPILTQFSDRFGRRLSFLIPLWITVASNIICSIAPNYYIFLIFRFIAGAGSSGFISTGWVLGCESVSIQFRSIIPLVGVITWVMGYLFVGIVQLFIVDWRWLYLAVSVPGLLTIPYYWLVPESLHWMITHKKSKGISQYIYESTKINGISVPLEECQTIDVEIKKEASKRSVCDIFYSFPIVFQLTIHCFIMMVMNFSYWGLSLFSTELSDDNFTGYMLSGSVELPAGLLSIPLLHIFGRRSLTFAAMFGQSLSMISRAFITDFGYWPIILPLMAKSFNTLAWASEPLMLTEMVPTSIRNVFYGIVGFFTEFGSIFAPYLNSLKHYDERLPALFLGFLSMLAAFLVLLSPETFGKPLPEDLNQFNAGPLWNIWRRFRRNEIIITNENVIKLNKNKEEEAHV